MRPVGIVVAVVVAMVGCLGPNLTTAPTVSSLPLSTGPTSSPSRTLALESPQVRLPVRLDDLSGTIAFSFDDGIWTSDADGRNRRQLTSDGGFDPTLAPDAGQIAYRLLLEHDDGEIWVIDAGGGHRRDLVNDPAFSDWGPSWSPDGRRIAFDSNRRVGLALWLMNADGSGQEILTTGHGEYPSWSPDGTQLAYAGGSYYDIRVVNADGSNDHALTSSAAYDMGPAWSPDGAWIAYHTQVDAFPNVAEPGQGPEMEIHLIRPDGTDDHRITDDHVEDSFPAWSPDGRFLMWARQGELVVARPDGSGMVEIGPGNFPTWIR